MYTPHKFEEPSIEEKLKLMTNYDSDKQFMAASDLSDIVEKNYLKLSPSTITQIVDALLDHLKQESTQLHGNAIKCLSRIISKIPIEECKRICVMMINNIISPSTNKEVRDIYGTCVKTIINDVAQGAGEHIKQLLKLAIENVVESGKEAAVEQELVDIISSFMKKWPRMVEEIKVSRDRFLRHLMKNIMLNADPILRKRSYICLGALAGSLTLGQFKFLLVDCESGLLPHLKASKELERKKIIMHSLLAILKNSNPNIQEFGDSLCVELLKQIQELKSTNNIEKADKIDELLEISIQALVWILRISPDLLTKHTNQLFKLSEELLEYSPYGQIAFSGSMEEEDSEGFEGDDIEDGSWKVRKAAIKMVVQLASSNELEFRRYMRLDKFLRRLDEKQTGIVECLINGFRSIFDSQSRLAIQSDSQNSLTKRESNKELLEQILVTLIQRLDKILTNPTLEESIETEAAKLVSCIGKLFTSEISTSQTLTHTCLQSVFLILNRTKLNEVKIELLNFYQFVLRNAKAKVNYSAISEQLLQLSTSNLYKVTASAFKALHALLSTGQMKWTDTLGNTLLSRMKESDIDQEIKQSVIGCVSEILNRYPNEAPTLFLQHSLEELLKKLSTELEKRHIVSAISKISKEVKLDQNIITLLNKIVEGVATVGLNTATNVIRNKAAEAINNILAILGKEAHKSTIDHVLVHTKEVFKEKLFPEFMWGIINTSPQSVVPYLKTILDLQDTPPFCIKMLLDSGVVSIEKLVEAIQQVMTEGNIKTIIDSISEVDINPHYLQGMKQSPLTEQLMIGYLGSKKDTKNFETFLNIVCDQKKEEHVRLESSRALGLCASQDIPKFLPILIKEMQAQKDNYLLVNSLKEMIIHSHPRDTQPLLELEEGLFDITHPSESVILSISECIGHIAAKYPKQCLTILIPKISSSDSSTRFLVSSSYRHLMNEKHDDLDVLKRYTEPLLGLLTDDNVMVRSATVKSLNTIAFSYPQLLTPNLNDSFFKTFNHLLEFQESLVEIVSYGSSKEKIDKGRTIRLDGFTFFETLLDKANLSRQCVDCIIGGCLDSLETQTSVDVLVSRVTLLKRISDMDVRLLKDRELDVMKVLGVTQGKLKEYKDKKQNTDLKLNKVMTVILEVVSVLASHSSKAEVKEELQQIKQVPFFLQKIKLIKKQ